MFNNLETHFVTKRKMKIICEDITINQIVADNEYRKKYSIFISAEWCEAKAVVQILSDPDFSEQFLFENLIIKHKPEHVFQHMTMLKYDIMMILEIVSCFVYFK